MKLPDKRRPNTLEILAVVTKLRAQGGRKLLGILMEAVARRLPQWLKSGYLERYSRLALILSDWRRPAESDKKESGSALLTAPAEVKPTLSANELAAFESLSLRRQISGPTR
jgi:hypothetical protein